MPIICRASNVTFVGTPLCQSLPLFHIHRIIDNYGTGRNADYMDLNVNFTITVIKAATILRLFPTFLKP